jgi:type I restriction enzyme R subunit
MDPSTGGHYPHQANRRGRPRALVIFGIAPVRCAQRDHPFALAGEQEIPHHLESTGKIATNTKVNVVHDEDCGQPPAGKAPVKEQQILGAQTLDRFEEHLSFATTAHLQLEAEKHLDSVREAVRATVIAASSPDKGLLEVWEERATYGKEVKPGSRKAGVVWHTQGSGKSITMACYAGKLLQQPEMKNPTLVVVTDRNDLDGQLFATFCAAGDLLKTTPLQAGSRDELREMLASRQAGGIIFTTVQKFALLDEEDEHPLLSDRSNIVVISDEAHRSQYGTKGRFDERAGKYVFGYAKHLRDALKNATFIGFTGTPIALEDKDTRAVFGDYVSIYDIQDAVDDGATVPIYYESRLAKLDVKQAEIDALNVQVDEVVEDEEDIASREKTKSEWAALEKLVGAEPRLAQVAKDLVEHFETRSATLDGKAMIVCMSRDICAQLYKIHRHPAARMAR